MAQDRILPYGSPLPASWLAGLQEYVGIATHNFHLSLANATTVQVVAGTLSDQVAIGIDGLFRYISSTVTSAITGTAGPYDVFAVCGPNSFTNIPTVDTDLTVYAFALQALAHGTTPTLTGTVTNFRKVGEVDWDGTKVTGFRQLQGEFTAVGNISATAPAAAVRPIRAIGVAGQTAALQTWESSVAVLATMSPTGGLALADALTGTTGAFTGNVSAGSLTVSGAASAASLALSGALSAATGTFSGALASASITVTGAASAASLALTGALTAASGTFTGGVSAASFAASGLTSTATLTVSGATTLAAATGVTVSPFTDSTTKLASTAFVQGAIAAAAGGAFDPTLIKIFTRTVHVAVMDDQTAVGAAANIIGSIPIALSSHETAKLVAVKIKCSSIPTTATIVKLQWDHGAHGTLSDVGNGMVNLTVAAAGYVETALTAAQTVSDGDEIAIRATTRGDAKGIKIAIILERTISGSF